MTSPTTNDIKLLMNTDKIVPEDDNQINNIDEYLNDDSISFHPENEINNDEVDNLIKEEQQNIPLDDNNDQEKTNSEQNNIENNNDDNIFTPPEELDEYQRASPSEKQRMKYVLLRKLASLAVENKLLLSKNYTLNDDYYDIKREYEYHTGERSKHIFVSNATSWTINGVGILELISRHYQFFGIDLTGWKDNVEQRKEELVYILKDLYDKYNISQSLPSPEIRFIMLIGSSALSAALGNYGSKYLGSLFGNSKKSMTDIEADATKQSLIQSNLNQDTNSIESNQEIFNKINEEASTETKMLQQLQTQRIKKGNYDIQEKYNNELTKRGLQKEMKAPNINNLPEDIINNIPNIVTVRTKDTDSKSSTRKKKNK